MTNMEKLGGQEEYSPNKEGWAGSRKKVAGAAILMAALAFGKDVLASEPQTRDKDSKGETVELEETIKAFARIAETYKKFNIENKEEINAQLKLYEENKKFLTRLPPDQKAEFKHEWAFTKFHQILNKYGLKEGERVHSQNSPEKFKPAEVEADVTSLLEVYSLLIEAKNFRAHSGEKGDYNRTVTLSHNIHRFTVDMSAVAPEAVKAKKELLDKIQRALTDLSRGETTGTINPNEGGINNPYWHADLEIKRGSRGTSSTIRLYYDPVLRRAVADLGGLETFVSPELKAFISAVNQD